MSSLNDTATAAGRLPALAGIAAARGRTQGHIPGRSPGARPIEDRPFAPRYTCWNKILGPCHTYAAIGLSSESFHWVDPENPVGRGFIEVIRDNHHLLMKVNNPMEIVQDEEAGKP
jgi:hypothetical protein